MTIDTSGKAANYTGSTLEKFIGDRLIERKYQFIDRGKFKAAMYLQQPIYTKQMHLGDSIYGTPMYGDFVLYHPEKWKDGLIIESKWQQSGTSTRKLAAELDCSRSAIQHIKKGRSWQWL